MAASLLAALPLLLPVLAAAGHSGTCPAAKVCNASVGKDQGLPCCQVDANTYECCLSSESCIPKVGCRCAGVRDYDGYTFEAFLAEFGKSYADEAALASRKVTFEANLEKVRAHNREYSAGHQEWYMAMNKFADWTEEEFARLLSAKHSHSEAAVVHLPEAQNPASVDWRDRGAVTPVKDQGGCGSCWAFSATETVESFYQIASGKLLKLAPQTYVDCVQNPSACGGTGGCEGGTAELAFNLTMTKGIALESDLPYRGSDQKCKAYKAAVKVSGYVRNPSNNAKAFETAVAVKGPQSIAVAADSWQLYGGGIFTGCSKALFKNRGSTLNHAVQAVGYSKDAWIVRNSWGPDWGEKGYIRLSRKSDNKTFIDKKPADGQACKPYPKRQTIGGECGILFDASYPTGVTAAADQMLVI